MNEYQAHAYAVAMQIWDSSEDADTFMSTPHSLLDGKTPLEVAETMEGGRQIEDILWKMYWGLPR